VPRAATLAAALRDGLARLRGELAFVRARGFRNLIAWLEPIVAGLESALPTLERLAAPAATPAPALAPTGGSLLGLIGAQLGALRKPPTRPPASSRDLRRSVATLLAPGSDFALQLLGELNGSIGGRLPAALAATEAAPSALGEVAALRVKAAPFGASAPQRPIFDSRGAVVGSEEWPLASATVRVVVGPSGDGPARIRVTVAVRRRGVEASQAFVLDPNAEAEVALGDVSGQVSHVGDGLGLRLNVRLPDADDRTRSYEIVHHGDVLLVTVDGHQLRLTIGQTVRTAVGERRIAVDAVSPAEDGALPTATLADEGPAAVDPLLLPLDGPYDRIVAGGWVLIESAGGGEPTIARALEVATLARADYAMSARVTQLTLDRRWVDPQAERTLAAARQRTVYAQSEPLTLAWEPIEEEVAGDTIELDAVYSGLGSGRWLIVAGERTDVPGGSRVPASELVMLADVQQGPDPMPAGDKPRTTLRLATPLAYRYRRATLKIWGNVVAATHGETREEVLGSASAGRAWQSFALSQAPLTHLAAANPLGAESTLEVRVDGVRWAEASSPLWLGPTDRGYVTRVDEREGVTVVFGDGRHGARPASGVENVRAVYRTGLGKRGNVRAEQISQLQSRPLGVSAVVNPLPATGGADPESRDEVRRNAPLVLGALDRLVSVADHEHFARARAGIGKASARRLSDGRRTVVHLTIAGAADVPIAPSSALLRSLREALLRSGDPHLPVVVAVRELALLLIRARVSVEAGYLWANVEPAVRAALLATFSFERRELGQDVLLAEVIAAIQSVPGVSYVDVETLAKVPESASPAELAALAQTLPPRPAPRLIAELARFEEQSHAVLAGETLAGIAGQHGLDLDELLRLNPELASATPAAGTELIVRRGLRPAQLLLLTPALADTLLLEEIGP
jgi:predicted phage baseplate assembly protein